MDFEGGAGVLGAAGAGADDEVVNGGVDGGLEGEEGGGVGGGEVPPSIEVGDLAPGVGLQVEDEGVGAGVRLRVANDCFGVGIGVKLGVFEGDSGGAGGLQLGDKGLGSGSGEEQEREQKRVRHLFHLHTEGIGNARQYRDFRGEDRIITGA